MQNDDLFVPQLVLIPKIFHFVWLGKNKIPLKDQGWIKSWGEKHSNWKTIIWAEYPELVKEYGGEIDVRVIPDLVNQEIYDNIDWATDNVLLAAKSDIIRVEIVARYGGIYLDTDVECFGNIEPLLQNVKLFYSDEWGPNVGSNYMFGAIANHQAMWSAVRDLENHLKDTNKVGNKNVLFQTGPYYLSPILRSHTDCLIFPYMLFSPLCYYHDSSQVEIWPKSTMGNHHCTGKWFTRQRTSPPEKFLNSNVSR